MLRCSLIIGDNGCGKWQVTRELTAQVNWLGPRAVPLGADLHSSDEPSVILQSHSDDGIIIIIIIIIMMMIIIIIII